MELNKDKSEELKGIGILLMYIFHLFYVNGYLEHGFMYFPHLYIDKIGLYSGICVSLFVFITGYGLSVKGLISIESLLLSIFSLYKKMWFIYIICIPFLLYFSPVHNFITFKEVVKDLVGIGKTNFMWWYCFCYIFIVFTYFLYSKYVPQKFSSDLIILLIFLLLGISKFYNHIYINSNLLFYVENYFRLLPYLFLGCLFSKYTLFKNFTYLYNKNILVHIFILNLIIMVQYLTSYAEYSVYFLWSFITIPLFIVSSLKFINYLRVSFVFKRLGKYSTYMWLIHGFFIFYAFEFVYYVKFWPLILITFTTINFIIAVSISSLYKFLNFSFVK